MRKRRTRVRVDMSSLCARVGLLTWHCRGGRGRARRAARDTRQGARAGRAGEYWTEPGCRPRMYITGHRAGRTGWVRVFFPVFIRRGKLTTVRHQRTPNRLSVPCTSHRPSPRLPRHRIPLPLLFFPHDHHDNSCGTASARASPCFARALPTDVPAQRGCARRVPARHARHPPPRLLQRRTARGERKR
jgi:hypothetical protein